MYSVVSVGEINRKTVKIHNTRSPQTPTIYAVIGTTEQPIPRRLPTSVSIIPQVK